ncbi:MAG: Glu-tRNA(Gln) amidotransferase subunit GatE [Candidatus Aenigmarchaeota archaeon]|nr:Glu-tRNA(Gln) amidotransferase subunit GatE [Candidatus Aenigmarchaeota archaeon]
MDKKINYKSVRLKAGLELHQQLNTKHKLFCKCPTEMKAKTNHSAIIRKQHVVRSELGEADTAAQFEFLRDRTFHYQIFPEEVCLVCVDEEPPHELNREALDIALQVALLLNCETIPTELHVMRKIVIDGSTPMGFQRTVVVGMNGHIGFKGKRIPITQITLEEDAGAIVEEKGGNVTFRLNRIGVPLVEIDTGILEGFGPAELQEIAYIIGIMVRSTGKTKQGIGAIRQDMNVSIRNGQRVEVKGIQELSLLSKVVEFEVQRQMKEHAKPETRGANQDGTTRFLRPLSGSNRMYPETDIPPFVISKQHLEELKKSLPEPLIHKLERFKSKFKLSNSLAEEIMESEYLSLFEKIMEKVKADPTIVANTFTSIIKDLVRREKVEINRIYEHRFFELFEHLADKKIIKESIPEIIKYLASYPQDGVSDAVKELNLRPLTASEVKDIANSILSEQPNIQFEKLYGIVMSKVRGKIDSQEVMHIVKSLIKK